MKKVLVPTDYTDASAAALGYAISLAKQTQAHLLVVHVEIPAIPALAGEPVAAEPNRLKIGAIEAQLSQASQGDQGLVHEVRRLLGDPAKEIIRVAAAENVDLIVMPTSGRTGLRRMLFGSVAEAVVRGAPCPVLTLKEPRTGEELPLRELPAANVLEPEPSPATPLRVAAEAIVAAGELSAKTLLEQATAKRATDVHLHPVGDVMEVRFRIDGRLEHHSNLPVETGQHLLQQLKVMADLDISDPFHAHEGSVRMSAWLPDYEIRVTMMPVVGGESAALRLLKRERLLRPLESLGLTEVALAGIRQMLCAGGGEGVVLVTGPSNSGKTTTAYSMVHVLDNGHRNIVTIEDPPEYRIPSFRQLASSSRQPISMTSGLRTLLRMDPDIVLVGEVRDVETAEIAMRAASSGKFVFTTLHTRDVASTITAVRDLNIDNRSLAANLTGIISQRLLRRLCTHCRHQVPCDAEAAMAFTDEGMTPPQQLYVAQGCEHCQQTGYFERIGIFEVVPPSRELRKAIELGVSEDEIRTLIRSQGIPTLASDALAKVAQGVTSLAEARGLPWATLPLAVEPT